MKKKLLLLALVFGFGLQLVAQVATTANDGISSYNGLFRPGINLGYYPPFNDKDLGNLAAGNPELGVVGIGAKTTRPALTDEFLEQWGYDIRINEFAHYGSVGLEDLTCIVGYPSRPPHANHIKQQYYDCGGTSIQSFMFENLYTPIWDGGANGTPYNDNNYYAAYIYKLVTQYGDHIKYWEVWNEPAHTQQWQKAYESKSFYENNYVEGNWWQNDPAPCDLDRFYGTIQEYVRMMRITYDIVKTIDPNDYVLIGGVAFPSFLDAVLRNTDNPNGGAVSAEYPLGGGAYFDVMGIHVYPDIDGTLRHYDSNVGGFVYERHSDQAASSIERKKGAYEEVLNDYGYNGSTYPQKEWIITELNSPRRLFNQNSIASEESQVNFLIKAMTKAEKFGFHQVETYALVDDKKESEATDEFSLLGMYKNFANPTQGAVADYNTVVMNAAGRCYKTYSDQTFGKRYDAQRVAAMNLPNNIDGAAFKDQNGKYQYVLWAKTTQDRSENAFANYSFPASFNISQLKKQNWEASFTGNSELVGATGIQLSGRPIYLSEDLSAQSNLLPFFSAELTSGCGSVTTTFNNFSLGNPTTFAWTFEGGTPATSTLESPIVTFSSAGSHNVTLTIGDGTTTETLTKDNYINIEANANPQFTTSVNGLQVSFTNTSTNSNSFRWYFGDGAENSAINPIHTYNTAGAYEVRLEATNNCGVQSMIQTLNLTTDAEAPVSAFSANVQSGCEPLTVQFTDVSSNNPAGRSWNFPGGTPSTSTSVNPVVVYNTPGSYAVSLSVSNAAGSDFKTESNYITVTPKPTVSFTFQKNGNNVSFSSSIVNGSPSWNFGDGSSSTEANPTHAYSGNGDFVVTLTATNDCGSVSDTKTVSISGGATTEVPVTNFVMDNTIGCSPMTVSFTNTSTNNPTSYNWTFVGGTPSTSTDANPTVVFTGVGEHAIILVATNSAGSNTKVQTITVETTPTVNFGFTKNAKEVNFSSNINNGTIVGWNFGDGSTSTEINPTHTYDNDGTYTVVLTVGNDCGQVDATSTVQVSTSTTGNGPVSSFEVVNSSGCAPFVVEYKDLSTNNPTTWNWSFPGGTPNTSVAQHPIVVYSQAGIYSATLTSSNSSGFHTITKGDLVSVNSVPKTDFNILITASQVSLINTSKRADSFAWEFGDGQTSTDENPVHIYENSGTYIVTLTTMNECGNTSRQESVVIALDVTPITSFTVDHTEGCTPFEVKFTDLSSMNPDHWVWSFPGGTPSTSIDQNPVVTYETPGLHSVSLTATNSAGSNTTTETGIIHVFSEPKASFYTIKNGPSVQFINTSEGGGTYLWDLGDDQTSAEESLTHLYKYTQDYAVSLTAANLCGTDNYERVISVVATANNDLEALNVFELTPNPTSDIVTLEVKGRAERHLNVKIYDILGVQLMSRDIDFKSGMIKEQIRLAEYANGTYIIKVQTENQMGIQKIVLQK